MLISLATLLATLFSIFRSRVALELEDLALRHQISVLQVDEQNDQIAHRRIVAGRGIPRNHGRNNNSPATGRSCSKQGAPACRLPDHRINSPETRPPT